MAGGVNEKQLRRCKNMSDKNFTRDSLTKEEMIAEIHRVLEDANEWEVRDVYEHVMDEVG
jgi:hypothetical protein